jgi:hypothetical protein
MIGKEQTQTCVLITDKNLRVWNMLQANFGRVAWDESKVSGFGKPVTWRSWAGKGRRRSGRSYKSRSDSGGRDYIVATKRCAVTRPAGLPACASAVTHNTLFTPTLALH